MESTDESKSPHISFEEIDLGSQLPSELDFLRHLDEDMRPLACEFIRNGAGQLLANNLRIKLNQFPKKGGKAKKFMANPTPFYIEFVAMPAVPAFINDMNELLKLRSSASISVSSISSPTAKLEANPTSAVATDTHGGDPPLSAPIELSSKLDDIDNKLTD